MDSENPQLNEGEVPTQVTNESTEEVRQPTETEVSSTNEETKYEEAKPEEANVKEAKAEGAKPEGTKAVAKKKPKASTKKAAKAKQPTHKMPVNAKAAAKSPVAAARSPAVVSSTATGTPTSAPTPAGEVTPTATKSSASPKRKVSPKKTIHTLTTAGNGEKTPKKSQTQFDMSPTAANTPSTIASPPPKPSSLFGRAKSVAMKTRFDISGDLQLLVSQGEVWRKLEDPSFTTRKQAIRQNYPNSRDNVRFENGSLSVMDGAKRSDEPKFLNRVLPSDNHDGPFERGNCKASQRDHLNRSLVLREDQPLKLARARVETKPREKLIL